MQEGGIVRVHDGRALVADLEAFDLPATVQGAVLSLVDRLTARQQLTLKVAAVVGRAFSVQAVVEAHPTGTETRIVEGDLEALLERDLLAPDDSEPEPAYTFRHQITRDVAYGLLTPTQRRLLHRRVAEWYERTSSELELARNAALLAHHWKCAEEPKAVPYLEKASEQALRGGAFREAAHLYGQLTAQTGTTAADDDVHRLALWEKGEAVAYYYLGDFGRSRGGLQRALAHLDRPVPRGGLGLTWRLWREVTRQLAHLALPARYRDRRSGERRLLLEAVDAYKMLALIDYVGGESTQELLYLFLAAVNLGEEAGASPELASALATVAGVTSLFNLRSLTDRYVARARQLAEDEGQFQALAWVWNVQAVIEAQRGDWRRSVAASDRALELFGEIGDYNYEAEIWQTRAGIHICHGDFAGAEPCWTRTRELAARNSNAQLQGWSLLDEVQTQLGRGDTPAAGRALEAVLSIDDAPDDQHTEIEKHYCLAATRLAEGRSDEALSAADHLLEVATARPLTGFWLADFAAGAVEVYVELLEQAQTPEERRTMLRRARGGCRSLRRASWTFHGVRPRRETLLGRVEWERGKRRRAVRLWRRVASTTRRNGMDYELARAHLELARHEVASDDRKDMLDEAERTFERLGAGRQLERTRRL
jgi:tetratricopeptide (TPR) repeat protein